MSTKECWILEISTKQFKKNNDKWENKRLLMLLDLCKLGKSWKILVRGLDQVHSVKLTVALLEMVVLLLQMHAKMPI